MPGDRDQNISITFNGYKVGGDSGRPIHGMFKLKDGYAVATLSYDFLLAGFATEDDLNTAAQAAEEALRTPRSDCVIVNGTGNRKSFSHSGATGFDADPQCYKVGDNTFDTSWSCLMHAEASFGRPANNVGTSGRRTSTVTVGYEGSRRRTITIEGEYTQIPGGSGTARGQYEGAITAYQGSVLSFLGVSRYDLLEEPVTTHNDTNKTLQFRRVFRELRHGEFGVSEDSAVIGLEMDISQMEDAPGDTPPATRVVKIGVDFSCFIDFDQTDDLEGKWESILPAVINEAQGHFARGPVGLVHAEHHANVMSNRLEGHLVLEGYASNILESRITTRDYIVHGNALDPAWSDDDRTKYLFKAPRQIQRTITRTQIVAKGGGFAGGGGGAGGAGLVAGFGQGFGGGAFFNGQGAGQGGIVIGGGAGAGGGGAGAGAGQEPGEPDAPPAANGCVRVPITSDFSQTPLRRGLSGYSFDVVETLQVDVFEYFIPVAIAAGPTFSGRTGRAS